MRYTRVVLRSLIIGIALPFLLGCTATTELPEISGEKTQTDALPKATVVSVGDGDTFRAEDASGEVITIRVAASIVPNPSKYGGQRRLKG